MAKLAWSSIMRQDLNLILSPEPSTALRQSPMSEHELGHLGQQAAGKSSALEILATSSPRIRGHTGLASPPDSHINVSKHWPAHSRSLSTRSRNNAILYRPEIMGGPPCAKIAQSTRWRKKQERKGIRPLWEASRYQALF